MLINVRIKEQRLRLNLTQPQLADRLGVSLDMVKSLEIGRVKPSIENLAKLSDIFGCTTDYLLGRTEKSNLVMIETWEQFHEYMDFALNLIKLYSLDHAKSIQLAARKYPRSIDQIPDEKEDEVGDFLRRTLDTLEQVKKKKNHN